MRLGKARLVGAYREQNDELRRQVDDLERTLLHSRGNEQNALQRVGELIDETERLREVRDILAERLRLRERQRDTLCARMNEITAISTSEVPGGPNDPPEASPAGPAFPPFPALPKLDDRCDECGIIGGHRPTCSRWRHPEEEGE